MGTRLRTMRRTAIYQHLRGVLLLPTLYLHVGVDEQRAPLHVYRYVRRFFRPSDYR